MFRRLSVNLWLPPASPQEAMRRAGWVGVLWWAAVLVVAALAAVLIWAAPVGAQTKPAPPTHTNSPGQEAA
jgi:hypothetical protein